MMKTRIYLMAIPLLVVATAAVLFVHGQQPPKNDNQNNTANMANEEMNKRGDHVMGFDHKKTTHHFRLVANGGSIEVTANSNDDRESRDQIRLHLRHIAKMFAEGNFNAPILIHEQTPPGAEVMQSLKDEITYSFEEIDRGAAVRISTRNAEALRAIHSFLRFQIKEHKTGDSLESQK